MKTRKNVWCRINNFDPPVKCIFVKKRKNGTDVIYRGKRMFIITPVYESKEEAELLWIQHIMAFRKSEIENPDLYATDEIFNAYEKAWKLLNEYIEKQPHLIFKYF